MQIFYIVPYIPSLIRVRPYQLIRELAGRHDVSVLAVDSPRAFAQLEPLRQWCTSVEAVPLRLTTSVRSCIAGAARGDPLQARVCLSSELERRVVMLLDSRRFDVVHVEHLRAAALGTLISGRVPTVFDAVDSISLLLRRTLRSSHSIRQRLIAILELRRTAAFEGRMLRQFDRTVVTSPDDRQALQALAPAANVTVIPNGVDLEYFRPLERAPDPHTIVFSGKMSYHANVTAALYFVQHIFPLIRVTKPQARLRIVGSNPPRAIQALSADPNIQVTGHVSDLRSYVGTANVAVCPVTVKVGIQNKLLEAMAMGVPVVSTALGAEGLSAAAGRELLVARQPAEFAAHVTQVFDNPALAQRLGAAGRQYVERYHRWSSAAEALEREYKAAIALSQSDR